MTVTSDYRCNTCETRLDGRGFVCFDEDMREQSRKHEAINHFCLPCAQRIAKAFWEHEAKEERERKRLEAQQERAVKINADLLEVANWRAGT